MAAGATYTPISTQTLGSATAAVTLSSIPSTYTDLVLECVFGTTAGTDLQLQFNGDTATNYSSTRIVGNGTSGTSTNTTSLAYIQPRTPANQPTTITTTWRININSYANTTSYKTTISRYDSATVFTEADVGLWRSTSAISSCTVTASGSTFVAGSIFTLYGIAAA